MFKKKLVQTWIVQLETKKIKNFTNDVKDEDPFSQGGPEICVL
jgi:hypothetical protein